MTRIFISYRRDDDPYAARGINNALCERFGEQHVYFDLDDIQAGLDFRTQIDEMLAKCDVMLVVIGDDWFQVDESGCSRLEDADDLVGLEVSVALERGIPVIPVLVGSATVPTEDTLPEALSSLSYRQAVEVRATANFNAQIDRLIKHIEAVTPSGRSRLRTRTSVIASGAVVLVVLVIVQSVSARARQAQDENLDTVDLSAESPVEVSRPERSPSSRAMVLAFDPSTQRWSGEDIFEIEQNLEIENGVLNFGRSEASGFEAQLIAEYPGRRVYRLPELGVLMETDWSLGVDDMLTEPILRRISTGALIAKLNIMSASLNRSNGLIAGVSKTDKNLLQVFNANDGRLERTIHIPQLGDEEPLRVDFAPDGLHLFVATYENSWMSVRIEDGQAEWKIKLSSEEWLFNLDVSFDQTGESALLFSGDDRPQRVRLRDGVLLRSVTIAALRVNVHGAPSQSGICLIWHA